MSVAAVVVDPDWAQLRANVRKMLGGRLASGADTEDVVQEVLIRVLRGAPHLRETDRFGPWLAATVRNAVVDQLRVRQRHPLPRADRSAELADHDDAQPDEDAARASLVSALRPFAERLPAIYRDVIVWSELEGMPHAEIAKRLSMSISGVKSRVQRGRERLHQMLNDCCQISLDARNSVVECVPKDPDSAEGCCDTDAPVALRRQ